MPANTKPIKFIEVVRPEEGALMCPGCWIFRSLDEFRAAGATFEADGNLCLTPLPEPAGFDWKKRSLIHTVRQPQPHRHLT